jgi:hypothetical protein
LVGSSLLLASGREDPVPEVGLRCRSKLQILQSIIRALVNG